MARRAMVILLERFAPVRFRQLVAYRWRANEINAWRYASESVVALDELALHERVMC